jgi:hypothetical protein
VLSAPCFKPHESRRVCKFVVLVITRWKSVTRMERTTRTALGMIGTTNIHDKSIVVIDFRLYIIF